MSDNSPPDGSVGILVTFMLPATAHATLTWTDEVLSSEEARRDALTRDLVTLFGPRAAHPAQYLERPWTESRGSPAASTCSRRARTVYADWLTKPVGNVHWAGAETSLDDRPGYMDGAGRAGERAARDATAAL